MKKIKQQLENSEGVYGIKQFFRLTWGGSDLPDLALLPFSMFLLVGCLSLMALQGAIRFTRALLRRLRKVNI